MLQPLPDTLSCDSTLLHQFRADEAYNYARELQAPDLNLLEWLMRKIADILSEVFSVQGRGDFRILIYIALALVFVAVIVYLLYRYQPRLFGRVGHVDAVKDDEDNIYGVDFDAEYAKAMALGDYYRAVRMVYLRTLRWLADRNKISWQLYKTPTQYTREFLSDAFLHETNGFMRVRYGNYPATEGLVRQLLAWEAEVKKGGEA
ncbi:MAG: DUF4129 domain-containing protein [Prevotella sp.]|nr:DUF4129 domain-containing protein [Prevotella sp.]